MTLDLASECWDILGVSDYLQQWWDQHESECNTKYSGKGFASCYQQKLEILDYRCADITVAACYHPDYDRNITIHEYYVLYSILSIWTWYNSIWEAVGTATFRADLSVGEIIATINPVLPGDTSLGVLLSALSAGFAFLGVPAGGGTATKLIATAVGQTPGLVKALLPTGSLDSEIKQMDEIEENLGLILDQFQINVANALNITQTDFSTFSTAVSNGSFIADQASLNATTTELTRLLKTFVVSQALQANNIIITVASNISAYDLSQKKFTKPENGTMLPQNAGHVNCQDKPGPDGVCDNWWIDKKTNDSYSLFKLDDMTKNFYDLMKTMFTSGWTTGEDLFLGSEDCLWKIVFSPFVDPEALKSQCFSSLRVCYWNQSNDPSLHDGYELESSFGCPFAWPNLCIDGRGFKRQEFLPDSEIASEDASQYTIDCSTDSEPDNSSLGYAQIIDTAFKDGYPPVGTSPDERLGQIFYSLQNFGDPTSLLAYNSLYDVCNNRLSALEQQATQADPKQCKYYPLEGSRPGWGGAGYHRTTEECDIYPASYIGPGLWLDTEFCNHYLPGHGPEG